MREIVLLTATEVAQILKVKPARVYELAREKALPCVRLLRQVRFSQTALEEFIKQGGTIEEREDE